MTLDEFLAPPAREAWEAELAAGWSGPDGSSSSLDDIEGVRIGITSTSHEHHALPANRHDWRYHLGRTRMLPPEFRAAADREYRDGCAERVRSTLIGWRVKAGEARAHARFYALRLFGGRAWRHGT